MDEFVEYLGTRQLAPTQVFEMVGLLFASANERLIVDPSADLLPFHDAVMRRKDAARAQYEYWVRLNDSEEFPLGDWLRGNRTMFGTAE